MVSAQNICEDYSLQKVSDSRKDSIVWKTGNCKSQEKMSQRKQLLGK